MPEHVDSPILKPSKTQSQASESQDDLSIDDE
jgi:hypothetical protein